ncbi:MAG TPA: IreB family regulatory phosphoprotein [Syntrophomonadaceae bacterium]|nr:IreB family regulatory phosphoprotein [Syntrophomonadaceae bacterium]
MSENELDKTMAYRFRSEEGSSVGETLMAVYAALKEKGYNPISQLVGYLLSGDPGYITNYRNARNLIRKYERDELIEELVTSYLEKGK